MIFLGGTSGFHYGQVVLQIHLSVGQVDFFDEMRPLPGQYLPVNKNVFSLFGMQKHR